MYEISIVIPVYKSQNILTELARQIDQEMSASSKSYELILVCDGSPDDSWSVIKALAAQNSSIRGVLLRNNFGQHNAVLCGMARSDGEVVVTMDDDLQHSPKDILALVSGLSLGYQVVYGKFQNRQHSFWKRIGSRVNDIAASLILGKPRNLYLSPFRAIRREVVQEIVKFTGPFVYIDGQILEITNSISSVLVSHQQRFDGTSGYSFAKSLRLLVNMATSTSLVPLRFTALAGLWLSLASFGAGIVIATLKLLGSSAPVGWASLIVTVLFAAGVQLFTLGVLGEYLGKVSLASVGKRQYVVQETLG
jgi:undecaprenyl-phosphate 4-deoxy-4-formamido-L-arabinose transferase